jgi:hypothetical protein
MPRGSHRTGYYGRRNGTECALRDAKDPRFGMGMGAMHGKSFERRDHLWLINAFALVLLTLFAAAGEAPRDGQAPLPCVVPLGCMFYDLILTMPKGRTHPMIQRFSHRL